MNSEQNHNPRRYNWQDRLIMMATSAMGKLSNIKTPPPQATRPYPADNITAPDLTASERQHSAALMRINHVGEVCAQALYLGQSITARDSHIQLALKTAALEEHDHLMWCKTRIEELEGRTSFLTPVWYASALAMGAFAGIWGDKWSLGFLAETEHQVYQHLDDHLQRLPKSDLKSRAILMMMKEDEAKHANTATAQGAATLPFPIPSLMTVTSQIMVRIAYLV